MSDFEFRSDDVQSPPIPEISEYEQDSASRPPVAFEHAPPPGRPRAMLVFVGMSVIGMLMLSGQGLGLHSLVKFQEATLELAAERDIWEAEKRQREDTVAEWKNLVAGVKKDLQDSRIRKGMLAEELEPLEAEHSTLVAKADAARKRLDLLETSVEEAVAAQKDAEKRTQDAVERHQQLSNEISSMQSRLAPLKTDIENLTAQRDAVSEALQDMDATLKKYVEQLAALRNDCTNIQDDILERRKERTEAEKSYRAATDSLQTITAEMVKVKAERDALALECDQMNALKAQKAQLEGAVATAKKAAASAAIQQEGVQAELDRLTKERDEIEDFVMRGKAAKASTLAEYQALKPRKESLDADVAALQQETAQLKKEEARLEGAIQSLKEQGITLERECEARQKTKELLDRQITKRQETLKALIESASSEAPAAPFGAAPADGSTATPSKESE